MKKVLILLSSLLLVLLTSCASSQKMGFDVDVQYESESPAVTVVVTPVWSKNLIYGSGFGSFVCTFKNESEKAAKVVWEESSINYNGSSAVPFIDGQKYAKAQEPMSPTVIAKNGSITKAVYSSNQPHYNSGQYGGWVMLPIKASEVQLMLMVKSEKGEEYITVNTKVISE